MAEVMIALVLRTAFEWNVDPRNKIRVLSWSDFDYNASKDGVTAETRITWEDFRKYRENCSVQMLVPFSQLTPED